MVLFSRIGMRGIGLRARVFWLLGAAFVLIVGAGLTWSLRRQRLGSVPPLRVVSATILPGVHVLADLGPSVAYAIETPDGLVLIDSGLEADAGPLKAQMARLGLDWRRVRAVLLTHAHGDHCGGAERLRTAAGAKIHAGRGDAGVIRAGGPREAVFANFAMADHALHPTSVDVELDGNEVLTFGDVHIRTLALPGHTPGSMGYILERGGLRVLFSGDVVFSLLGEATLHSDARDPLGTYSAYLPPRYRGDALDFVASLRRLRALPAPDLVLPGHPGSDPTPQSPLMSQERWERMLEQGIRAMEVLAARYQTDGADFLDGAPKALLPDLYYLGDFQGRAVYGLVAGSRFIVVGSVGASGFDTFLRESQHKLGLAPREPAAVLLTGCGSRATAGLAELIEHTRAEVFGPDAGLRKIKAACPPGARVSAASALARTDWFPGEPIALPGRGRPMVAYRVVLRGKRVLFTDRVPILFAHDRRDDLLSELLPLRSATLEYLLSTERLTRLEPNLWLPAQPHDGQNANLYDREWKVILDDNLMAGAYRLGQQ